MSDHDRRDHQDQPSMDRRNVLRALSLAAMTTPVAAAAPRVGQAEPPHDPQMPEYRETEHIRRYYALSRRF